MGMGLHPRRIQSALSQLMDEFAVVRLSGPRASGKTTTCVAEIEQRGGTVVRLDDPRERHAVESDPTGYLAGLTPPILIDEYQRVPAVLDVIKSDLSMAGTVAGRWLLSGSISISATTSAAESLGGRLTDLEMGTLTVDERNDAPPPGFLTLLADGDLAALRGWRSPHPRTRDQLLDEAIRGGFPLVTDRSSPAAHRRSLEDWVSASVIADGAAVGGVRNTQDLQRMLHLYAASTASITPKNRPLADRLEIDRRTVARYRDLLSALHVTWDLPSFAPGNATGQVTKSPKLHVVDSGLAAMLASRDQVASLRRDPRFAGALVETMVANDLRVQANAHPSPPRLHHFREDSDEVDLVIERTDGGVVGVEVKLSSSPGSGDLKGMRRLRRSSGSRWVGGVVVCRVPVGRVDDGIAVAPLDAVWDFRD